MINYGKHSIDKLDEKAVIKTLRSKNITQGSEILKFENDLSKFFGSKYASVLSSGTAGLHLTAKALNWKSGDIVFCSPITFLASSNSIIYQNSTPIFIDINLEDYNIDPNLIEAKLKKKNIKKSAKAIIATDFAGHPCDWDALKYLSKKYNLKLINDNCHAIGAEYKNTLKYAQKYADFVIHSYHAVKNITTGEGGAVLTNSKYYKNKIDELKSHGVIKNIDKTSPWKYEMINLGLNYRMTDIQASLGISQLKKLNRFLKKRRDTADLYNTLLSDMNYCKLTTIKNNVKHAYHLFPILIDFNKVKINKSQLFKIFKKNNINLQVHYIPIYKQPYYKKMFKYSPKDFPNSEKFYNQEVSIPIFPDINKSTIYKVVSILKKYIQ